jgi:hypothetical protein
MDDRRFYCTATDVRKFTYNKQLWLRDFFNPPKTVNVRAIKKHNYVFSEEFFDEEVEAVKRSFAYALKPFTTTVFNDELKLKGRPDAFFNNVPVEIKFKNKVLESDRMQTAVYCLLFNTEFCFLATPYSVERVFVKDYREKVVGIAKKIYYFKKVAAWCGFRR